MWPPWMKSPNRVEQQQEIKSTTNSTRTLQNFSCSSFKDIQTLLTEPDKFGPFTPRTASIFHRVRISNSILRAFTSRPAIASDPSSKPDPNDIYEQQQQQQQIVVYFTSLRVVRKTFEECRTVRSILRGFRVSIDERDVSMDATFLHELQRILGRKCATLPSVFIGGRFIGGADEIRRLNETDELKKMIGRFPLIKHNVCNACYGYRFTVCEECNGSRKVYVEKTGFRNCTICNANGLIKCSSCSSLLLRCRES